MTLEDLARRVVPAEPWAEGDNIPWDDPAFSERMLAVHLSQQHDLASRRFAIIDQQVRWIHRQILTEQPTVILDLACGPGLYTGRLARLGHTCVGIDFAPAAVCFATEQARAEALGCTYRQADIRQCDFGSGYGLGMILFGQINVFRPAEARRLLEQTFAALAPNGRILLEPQRLSTVESAGRSPATWSSIGAEGGLFSDRPHLLLTESFWDAVSTTATQRFFAIDAATHEVTRHAMTTQGYPEREIADLLRAIGFRDLHVFHSLVGEPIDAAHQGTNFVVTAVK